jgi:hypothetical protein
LIGDRCPANIEAWHVYAPRLGLRQPGVDHSGGGGRHLLASAAINSLDHGVVSVPV